MNQARGVAIESGADRPRHSRPKMLLPELGKAPTVEAPPSAAAIFRKLRRPRSFRQVIVFPFPFV